MSHRPNVPDPNNSPAAGSVPAAPTPRGPRVMQRVSIEIIHTEIHTEFACPPAATVRPDISLLITDDDDNFRLTLQGVFEREGFHTVLASCGEEAIGIIQEQPIHLALLDYNMPRLTGLETLRILRRMHAALPVIMITADATEQLVHEALSAQAFCVMSKPVSRGSVVHTVHSALSRHYSFVPPSLPDELRAGPNLLSE